MDSPISTQMNANRQIARAAGTVMFAFLISSLVSLARGIIILRTFGTGLENEAFNAANRVAETIFNLIAGGALASAFVPTFTSMLTKGKKDEAWKLAASIINIVIAVISLLALIAAIFAPQVVRYLLAPDWYINEPQKFALTVQLLRLILPSSVIFGVSGLMMGILNSHQSFFIPALAPSLYSIGIIFGVMVLSPGMGIFGLAYGVVIGASLHLLVQLPKLISLKGRYHFSFGIQNSSVHEVIKLMLPRLAGVAVVQINFWVNTNIASRYSEGSVTGLTYGFALMLMPLMFIAQAIATASLPTFSAQVAQGKRDEMRGSLAASLKAVLLLSIPAAIGMILLRFPLIQTLYQNDIVFNSESTRLVAWALLWYAAGLPGHSVVEIVSRAFYAMHDTKTPVIIGIIAMSLNIILSIVLSKLFLSFALLPHGGLALANSIATGLESIALIFLMRKRLDGIEGKKIFRLIALTLLATTVMGAAVYLITTMIAINTPWLVLIIGLITGVIVFGFTSLMLGIEEVKLLPRLIETRLKKIQKVRSLKKE